MKSTKLFSIFGIDIKIHFSWWFIFALLTWSLSTAFFPAICQGKFPNFTPNCAGITTTLYWFMGITATLLLFVSVLLHELSHSLMARVRNIKVDSITLFFFGGVAGLKDEEMRPTDELLMALAGPFFSLFLAGVFFLIFKFNGSVVTSSIMFYLFQLNLILAIFNMVPGYPLDGGRAFRAILHAYYHDLKKATAIAVKGGKFFAAVLILLGFFSIFTGMMNGLWFIFLGGFLWFIAGMSYEQVIIKETLSQIPVKVLMNKKYPKLDSTASFSQVLQKYTKTGYDNFLVQKGKNFLGIIDLKKINKMPVETQKRIKVNQIMIPSSKVKTLGQDVDTYRVFRSMLEQDLDILPLLKKDKVLGVVYKKDLMHRLIIELKYSLSVNHAVLKDKIKEKRVARKVKRKVGKNSRKKKK